MISSVSSLRSLRQALLASTQDLSLEQVNRIPQGFRNNIAWNMGHMIASMQGLCYQRSGVAPRIQESMLAPYRPGTVPEHPVDEHEWKRIGEDLIRTADWLEQDLESGLFTSYDPLPTRSGITLSSAREAADFLLFHQGFHQGYIAALRHCL